MNREVEREMFFYTRRGRMTYIYLQTNRKIFRTTKASRTALRMLRHNLFYRHNPLPANVRC